MGLKIGSNNNNVSAISNHQEKHDKEDHELKLIKDLQKRIFDVEKNFKSYCQRVNIDKVSCDIKNINDSMHDLSLNFNKDNKAVMENLSKKELLKK